MQLSSAQRQREIEIERAVKTRAPLTEPCSSIEMGMECTSTRELLIRLRPRAACMLSL